MKKKNIFPLSYKCFASCSLFTACLSLSRGRNLQVAVCRSQIAGRTLEVAGGRLKFVGRRSEFRFSVIGYMKKLRMWEAITLVA